MSKRRHELFVPGVGQHENIGDAVLRRPLIEWARSHGRVHVFVGRSNPGYNAALGLRKADVVYSSFLRWMLAALRQWVRGSRVSYFYKPGEIQLTAVGMKEHVGTLPLAWIARLSRGAVVRVGAGAKEQSRLFARLLLPEIWTSQIVAWRDPRTAALMGYGGVIPDLGFGEGSERPDFSSKSRKLMAISFRGDRPRPSAELITEMRDYATHNALEIIVVTQVLRDAPLSAELAAELDAVLVQWAGDNHDKQERLLRDIYRRARIVVSDRLHVLIVALSEGAVPIGFATDNESKIQRHFDAIGLRDMVAGSRTLDVYVKYQIQRSSELEVALVESRGRLNELRAEISSLMGRLTGQGRLEVRPVAVQIGRRGDVAGGMTQVVNSYLAWNFHHFETDFISSRDGARGLRALKTYAGAIGRVARLDRDRSVAIVHLSQGGSFVREGSLLLFARSRGVPVVAHLHGSRFAEFAKRHPLLVRTVLARADRIVSLSNETAAIAKSMTSPEKSVLLRNAVADASTMREPESLVVFGGAVSRRKGVDVLLEAWSQVKVDSLWTLVLAGPVREAGLLASLPENVQALGQLPHDQLLALLERSSIAVLPSRDEAMPIFIIEALARRNAVISTTVGGIPELLDDGAGITVPPGDVGELRAALQGLIDDRSSRMSYAERGRECFLRSFSAESIYPRIEDVWLAARDRVRT